MLSFDISWSSRSIQEPKFHRISFDSGPNQTMRKSPTTSDSRSMSQSSKQEGSYQTTSKKTKVDKQFTSRVSTLRTKPCPNAQDVQTNEVSTRSLLWTSRTRKRRITSCLKRSTEELSASTRTPRSTSRTSSKSGTRQKPTPGFAVR